MKWESLGFKDNPLSTDPITQDTLILYTGHADEMKTCANVLHERNVNLVIEGARGVGTTSFANYLRFAAQQDQRYLTPSNEIRVEAGWTLETLLSVVIANIVREIEIFHSEKVVKDKRFLNAKALSLTIAETYRSFGVEAFGFGVNYGKEAGITSQPVIVPSAVLGHHLEDLVQLVQTLGYKHGILLQLNNLDVGAIHEERHLKYLFNALRDYMQINGVSWLLVGDVGLRKFIAQEVDRLDDIISYEVIISPLTKPEYEELINKRIIFYRCNAKAALPVEEKVFAYLYEITKGRLRYIFGLLTRLMNTLHVGDLTDRITMEIAKPMLTKLARYRVTRNNLTPNEENVLRLVVKLENANVSAIAKEIKTTDQYASKMLNTLSKAKLVEIRKHGRNRYYTPVLDAVIAYTD